MWRRKSWSVENSPHDPTEPLDAPDAFVRLSRGIDDLNQRIDHLREDMSAWFRLLAWEIDIGFAAILSILGALLARGS